MPVHPHLSQTAQLLCAWYAGAARTLPWRVPPGVQHRPDPYAVWLSEIMLQQTTVAAVQPYYAKFIARWPNLADLAAADDGDVMAAWAGLGYYARARNLLACARAVVRDHAGAFPDTLDALRALPGLGDYSAASVAAITFGRAVPVVDANVERVMARLCGIDTPLPKARGEIRKQLAPLVPDENPGNFAQAMMDLGAMICTVRNPRCFLCPLRELCIAHRDDRAEELPNKPVKLAKPERHGIAYWVNREGAVLLVRRPAQGLLGGMLALPGPEWQLGAAPIRADCLARITHVFSHFRLTLDVIAGDDADVIDAAIEPWPISTLDDAGLPTLYAKAVRAVLASRDVIERIL